MDVVRRTVQGSAQGTRVCLPSPGFPCSCFASVSCAHTRPRRMRGLICGRQRSPRLVLTSGNGRALGSDERVFFRDAGVARRPPMAQPGLRGQRKTRLRCSQLYACTIVYLYSAALALSVREVCVLLGITVVCTAVGIAPVQNCTLSSQTGLCRPAHQLCLGSVC